MPIEIIRAAQDFFRNVMHSNLARYVTRSGILSLVETHAPELHPYVERNFDPVWNWIVENLF